MQKRKLKNTNKQTNKTNYHAFVRKRREVSVLMKKKKESYFSRNIHKTKEELWGVKNKTA